MLPDPLRPREPLPRPAACLRIPACALTVHSRRGRPLRVLPFHGLFSLWRPLWGCPCLLRVARPWRGASTHHSGTWTGFPRATRTSVRQNRPPTATWLQQGGLRFVWLPQNMRRLWVSLGRA